MPSSAAIHLLDLIQSQRVTAIIYVAARLGIAELLRDGPRPLDHLVSATKSHPGALRRLMTALSTVGICAQTASESYSLTKLGSALDGSGDQSLRAWAIFEGEMLSKSWSGMTETIMTGQTAAQLQGFSNSFELMSRSPENISVFNAAMADLTRLVTPDVLDAFDFSQITHLMDVGGGSGELLGAVAKRYPQIRGTVFDLPRCKAKAQEHLEQIGVSDRVQFVAGNFFESIPSFADGLVLKSVIHDWDDEHSSVILRNCHQALPRDGTLLLVERMMPETPTTNDVDKAHAMSDLNMLRGPGGLERTERQYRHLLEQSGFCQASLRLAGRFAVIEARAN